MCGGERPGWGRHSRQRRSRRRPAGCRDRARAYGAPVGCAALLMTSWTAIILLATHEQACSAEEDWLRTQLHRYWNKVRAGSWWMHVCECGCLCYAIAVLAQTYARWQTSCWRWRRACRATRSTPAARSGRLSCGGAGARFWRPRSTRPTCAPAWPLCSTCLVLVGWARQESMQHTLDLLFHVSALPAWLLLLETTWH